jgi:hypothetical protein
VVLVLDQVSPYGPSLLEALHLQHQQKLLVDDKVVPLLNAGEFPHPGHLLVPIKCAYQYVSVTW